MQIRLKDLSPTKDSAIDCQFHYRIIVPYFLITHPRSGSSVLSVALSQLTESWNLDEFFHLGNFQTWGDYKKILNSELDSGKVYSLIDSASMNISGDISSVTNIRKFILKETVVGRRDLILWKNLEMNKRLKFINDLSASNQPFIVKVFIDSISWFSFNFPEDRSLILYRKKFVDAIVSMMIKNYYYNSFGRKNFNDDYKGRSIIVPNFSFTLTYSDFYKQTHTFFRFLEFCRHHTHINLISYEEVYSDSSSTELLGKYIKKQLLDVIDSKLEYCKEKTEYIENFQEVHHWILQKIMKDDLKDICDVLKIDYECR